MHGWTNVPVISQVTFPLYKKMTMCIFTSVSIHNDTFFKYSTLEQEGYLKIKFNPLSIEAQAQKG